MSVTGSVWWVALAATGDHHPLWTSPVFARWKVRVVPCGRPDWKGSAAAGMPSDGASCCPDTTTCRYNTRMSALLPLMRDSRARLLSALLLNPDREMSIAELAREIGADGRRQPPRRRREARRSRHPPGPACRPRAPRVPRRQPRQRAAGGARRRGLRTPSSRGGGAERRGGSRGGPACRLLSSQVLRGAGPLTRGRRRCGHRLGRPGRLHERIEALEPRLRRPIQVVFRIHAAWEGAEDAFTLDVQRRPHVRSDVGRQERAGPPLQ